MKGIRIDLTFDNVKRKTYGATEIHDEGRTIRHLVYHISRAKLA